MIKSGIYKITNLINGKVYIGSAVIIKARWRNHRNKLKHKIHYNKHLQAAWNKYSEWNFRFEMLEVVEDESKLIEREQYWIDTCQACNPEFGYNTRIVAKNNFGIKFSKEANEKRANANRGKKRSAETCALFSVLRKNISYETRLKMSNSSKGRKLSAESKAKVSEALRKRVRTKETVEKIRASVKRSWDKRRSILLTKEPIVINI